MKCTAYDSGTLCDYKYVVTFAIHDGKWILCKHKERETWETSGGHIENGETPEAAARRELFEETGAIDFDIERICDYWACDEPHETKEIGWSNGVVFLARVRALGELPLSEMKEIGLFAELPPNLTYPDITRVIFPHALRNIRRKPQCAPGSGANHTPDRAQGRVADHLPDRAQARGTDRLLDRAQDRGADHASHNAQDRGADRLPDRISNRLPARTPERAAPDLRLSEIMEMQRQLQAKHKGEWAELTPEYGRSCILWMIEEFGELVSVIKKRGETYIMTDPYIRAAFLEEFADVLMFMNDAFMCYGISASEFSEAYIKKHNRNMGRDWAKEEDEAFRRPNDAL